MGVEKPDYDMHMALTSDQFVQVRSNSLEAARQTANKYLEREIPGDYFFRIIKFPHQVIREKKRATGAGADRLSQGMSMSFGKPVSVAARIKKGEAVVEVYTRSAAKKVVKEALRRASSKLSGTYSISTKALVPKAALN